MSTQHSSQHDTHSPAGTRHVGKGEVVPSGNKTTRGKRSGSVSSSTGTSGRRSTLSSSINAKAYYAAAVLSPSTRPAPAPAPSAATASSGASSTPREKTATVSAGPSQDTASPCTTLGTVRNIIYALVVIILLYPLFISMIQHMSHIISTHPLTACGHL